MQKNIFSIFTIISVIALSLFSATRGYANSEPIKKKLTITLPPTSHGAKARVGLTFTGKNFYEWTGISTPLTCGFRLTDEKGTEIPWQIEEYDGGDLPLKKGNGFFDNRDLFVFAIELCSSEKKIIVHYDESKRFSSVNNKLVKGVIFSRMSQNGVSMLSFKNRLGLFIGFPISKENGASESCAILKWKDITLVSPTLAHSSKAFFRDGRLSLVSSAADGTLNSPEILFSGPVRTLIVTRRLNCQLPIKTLEKPTKLLCNVTVVQALWNDCPIIDFKYIFEYKTDSDNAIWPIKFQTQRDKKQYSLIVPISGKAVTVQAPRSSKNTRIYATNMPEEGWFALIATKDKTGFAFCYEKMKSIRFRSEWVCYEPVFQPQIRIKSIYGEFNVGIDLIDRALSQRNTFVYEARFNGITANSASPDFLYNFWGFSFDELASISLKNHKEGNIYTSTSIKR